MIGIIDLLDQKSTPCTQCGKIITRNAVVYRPYPNGPTKCSESCLITSMGERKV